MFLPTYRSYPAIFDYQTGYPKFSQSNISKLCAILIGLGLRPSGYDPTSKVYGSGFRVRCFRVQRFLSGPVFIYRGKMPLPHFVKIKEYCITLMPVGVASSHDFIYSVFLRAALLFEPQSSALSLPRRNSSE
jgi:hypothetical protein